VFCVGLSEELSSVPEQETIQITMPDPPVNQVPNQETETIRNVKPPDMITDPSQFSLFECPERSLLQCRHTSIWTLKAVD